MTWEACNYRTPPEPVYFTQADPIGLAGGLNLYGYAGGDPLTFSDPWGLKADSLRVFGKRLAAELKQLRTTDGDIDATLSQLQASDRVYVIADADEYPALDSRGVRGWTYGGQGQEDLAAERGGKLGVSNAAGVSVVSTSGAAHNGTTVGRAAAHEAIHLKGIDDRNQKYNHCEPAFDNDPAAVSHRQDCH